MCRSTRTRSRRRPRRSRAQNRFESTEALRVLRAGICKPPARARRTDLRKRGPPSLLWVAQTVPGSSSACHRCRITMRMRRATQTRGARGAGAFNPDRHRSCWREHTGRSSGSGRWDKKVHGTWGWALRTSCRRRTRRRRARAASRKRERSRRRRNEARNGFDDEELGSCLRLSQAACRHRAWRKVPTSSRAWRSGPGASAWRLEQDPFHLVQAARLRASRLASPSQGARPRDRSPPRSSDRGRCRAGLKRDQRSVPTCRCVRGGCIPASSRADAGLPLAPPGFGECGVVGSGLAWHPRPNR